MESLLKLNFVRSLHVLLRRSDKDGFKRLHHPLLRIRTRRSTNNGTVHKWSSNTLIRHSNRTSLLLTMAMSSMSCAKWKMMVNKNLLFHRSGILTIFFLTYNRMVFWRANSRWSARMVPGQSLRGGSFVTCSCEKFKATTSIASLHCHIFRVTKGFQCQTKIDKNIFFNLKIIIYFNNYLFG